MGLKKRFYYCLWFVADIFIMLGMAGALWDAGASRSKIWALYYSLAFIGGVYLVSRDIYNASKAINKRRKGKCKENVK